MTVLLVLAAFVIFLTIDYFLSRKRAVQPALQPSGDLVRPPRIRPSVVAGFNVPDNVRYHPGHMWALGESPNLVRIGIDDFAARLLGKVDHITLPQRGQWVRQGQKILAVFRDGGKVEMVSPIEGIVSDINQSVLENPELARRDPYGDGWLVTVQAPDAKTSFRNLLGGSLALKWMEDTALRLRSRVPAVAGAVAQDGGMAVDDIATHLPDEAWIDLTREFFLS